MASPNVDFDDASSAAESLFNIKVKEIKSLGSCQDANFKLVDTNNDTYVLKFSNAAAKKEEIDFQNTVLQHVATNCADSSIQFPLLQKLTDGTGFVGQRLVHGVVYYVRLLTYIEGELLSDSKYLNDDSLRSFGGFIAQLNDILSSLSSELSDFQTQWDMRQALNTINDLSGSITDVTERARVVCISSEMDRVVQPLSTDFAVQVVHGDLAYYNVIAARQSNGRPVVSGVIDFGDATSSWVVGDLAIAITPLLIQDSKAPHLIAAEVLRGYLQRSHLNRSEVLALWPLIVQRAVVIYVSIAHQVREDPGNQYCVDELLLNRRILDSVARVPVYLAQEALLSVAGLEPSANSLKVRQALSSSHSWAPMLQITASHLPLTVVDWGVTSDSYGPGEWCGVSGDGDKKTHFSDLSRFMTRLVSSNATSPVMGVAGHGIPVLGRTKVHSHTAPATVPLFATFYTGTGAEICAPFRCTARSITASDRASTMILDGSESVLLEGLDGEGVSLLVYGATITEQARSGDELRPGTVVALVSRSSFTVQVLPTGLLPPAALLDASAYFNSSDRFSDAFLPPAYCTEQEAPFWLALCPDPLEVVFGVSTVQSSPELLAVQRASASYTTPSNALQLRDAHFAHMQEHYFRVPPVIERGSKQYLYDRFGRAYLDMVNNVAVVGHSHPAITEAVTGQLKLLNTNSRFIYDLLGRFTERIVSAIPPEITAQGALNKVFLVNSGSEATDLALRIARSVVSERRRKQRESQDASTSSSSFQMSRDVICLEGAYHGVTTASDEVSTTLNDNPRSLETRAPWVHLVPMPNLYRYTSANGSSKSVEEISASYVDAVRSKVQQLVENGTPPAVFIAEPLSGNAGGVELLPGYLQGAYAAVREVGGLCICDEVQVGYGRLGAHFWGFEEHGVVPDIITMAKAAGNGHPLGYVVTSRSIADEFRAAEGSFFSSAGGGPVSCAVGLAVLETLAKEDLQANVREVGAYLNAKLKDLQRRHPHIVGCIHGHGLYQGVELTREGRPATAESYAVCERLLELGVVCHNTGDYSNVLKVKPPLCFSRGDADFFVSALEIAFSTGW